MAEYIEREAVKKLLGDLHFQNYGNVIIEVMGLPAADVVEVKHGTWLPQVVLGQKAWDCSECKTIGSPQWNWCPMCGAKMDGGREKQ